MLLTIVTVHKQCCVVVQVLLMLLILLTGNYNFFNIVTIFLCLSLVDDEWLLGWTASKGAHFSIYCLLYKHFCPGSKAVKRSLLLYKHYFMQTNNLFSGHFFRLLCDIVPSVLLCLQCFDTVGSAAGRASGL